MSLSRPQIPYSRESEEVILLTDTSTHFEKGQLGTIQGPAASVHYRTCKLVWSTCGDSFPFTLHRSGGDRVEHEQDVTEPLNSELTLHSHWEHFGWWVASLSLAVDDGRSCVFF